MLRHARVALAVTAALLCAAAAAHGDSVKLRSGKVIDGMFIGADSRSVRILMDSGQVSEIAVGEVASIDFVPRKAAPASAPAPSSAATAGKPAPAAAPTPAAAQAPAKPRPASAVTVPAGTLVNVRLTTAIDVDASRAGQTFKAVVDDPVTVGGALVIPRGATAMLQAVGVEQSGKMKGSDKITLKLSAVSFGGMVHQLSTTYVESKGSGEGKKTARKVGGGAGLGAIVGGIAGGGEGAAIGAAIGAGTGAAVAAGGEEHLTLPAETRLQFQLSAAASIRP